MKKIKKTEEEWKKKLTKEQYHILREKGTEAPGTGKFLHHKKNGDYVCAACGNVLFKSGTKFDSGCGWPSFYDIAKSDSVVLQDDFKILGMPRVEVLCKKCGGHLGHVFEDGPRDKTGLRYCINSLALNFKGKEKKGKKK